MTPPGIAFGGAPALRKRLANLFLIGVPLIGSVEAVRQVLMGQTGWIEWSGFVVFYAWTGLGVSLGLHRLFSHSSYQPNPALAWLLAVGGTMAFQGSPYRWIIDHRRHHALTDRGGDTHSPIRSPSGAQFSRIRGLFHAHIGWMFDSSTTDAKIYGAGLDDNRIVTIISRTHGVWLVLSLLLPFLWGFGLGGAEHGWTSLLVAGCLRITALHQVVWAVNSIGHHFGERPFKTNTGQSTNNAVLALLTFGDGWHNNHHRFPRLARHGLREGEIDIAGRIIELFERVGLVRDVVKITPREVERALGAQAAASD